MALKLAWYLNQQKIKLPIKVCEVRQKIEVTGAYNFGLQVFSYYARWVQHYDIDFHDFQRLAEFIKNDPSYFDRIYNTESRTIITYEAATD